MASSFAQNLTVQVGATPPAPKELVSANDDGWLIHKGTNAPVADWKTAAPATLGSQWSAASGGFGYADVASETALCRTLLSDMSGRYSTLYVRKTFTIAAAPDSGARLSLVMDYDDAFVAYLDGVEIARSSNAPGAVGVEPAFDATATSSHESSNGNNPPLFAPATIDLGPVAARLAAGDHVLAVIGLNQSRTSSDFILRADLRLQEPADGVASGGNLFAILDAGQARISVSNLVGATTVQINGDPIPYDATTGTFSKSHVLAPGLNKLFIAATDAAGNLFGSTNKMIVSKQTFTAVGGMLAPVTEWKAGVWEVTNTIVIPQGGALTIRPGAIVLIKPGANIVGTNATMIASGERANPIHFLPADGASANWGGLIISGTNGAMTLDHVETISGHVELLDGAVGALRDSYFHDYLVAMPPIIYTLGVPNPVTLTLERCHIANYHEILSRETTNYFSDSLFEYLDYSGDGIDFDHGLEGSFIRRCTIRRGTIFNTDAIDMGEYGSNGTRVVIDSCLLHDFIDKGVSMGVAVHVTVTNTLIYNVDSGFGVKDNSVAEIFKCTVANANYGIRAYNKADGNALTGGGHITNSFNNIFWNLTNATISLENGSTLVASYTDFEGTNYPGVRNFVADPRFMDSAALDFRIQAASPTLGAGLNGADLGVSFPVGGIPATPVALQAIVTGYDAPLLRWIDDSDNETRFVLERSTDRVNWTTSAELEANATVFRDVNAPTGARKYYRVRAVNDCGQSDYSNLAGATRKALNVISGGSVGGVFTEDALFKSGAPIGVSSTMSIQSGVTLTIEAGARVEFATGAELIVNDGAKIIAEGTEAAPITFTRGGSSGSWSGLEIRGSAGSPESKISYAHIEFNTPTNSDPAIEVDGGTVALDHLTFGETTSPYLHLDGASFVVSDCLFPNATAPFELVHGTRGIKAGGRGIIRRCFFGRPNGYNDAIDFTGGNRPGPIIQFINNVFMGGGDDLIDLDGTDAWIEGNSFLHAHKNGNPETASGISGGSDSGQTSELMIIGNIFFDCDQAATAKQGNFYTFLHNTVARINPAGGTDTIAAVIQPGESGSASAAGMYLENNIVFDALQLVRTYDPLVAVVTFTNNILPMAWDGPGGGNVIADPMFVHTPTVAETQFTNWADAQIMRQWFQVGPGSPAVGKGASWIADGSPRLSSAQIVGKEFRLRFFAAPDTVYTVEFKNDLNDVAWTKLSDIIPPSDGPVEISDANLPAGARFYRLLGTGL